ncbi:MAG: sigma-54 dependent transcriptional regulator [Pyrinomonadaceae bacterium]|nr:sigma-54 dependent transcriptional regulator [Pyrinomonadaceae bacterium]MCX7640734.1 sigma-54 dependent transcriptional regulator [Pyrinomonadaceae bacterium]MDW8304629.1 sigma-54 dependent transcriptional regulator [Acidobacteriota bacterium]
MKSKILIVEDEENFVGSLQDFFEDRYLVKTANSLRFARSELSQDSFDVILLDNFLPDGKGIELIPEILRRSDRSKIILITAFPDFKDATEAIRRGAFDYIPKPIDIDELSLKIERALEFNRLQKIEQVRRYEEEKQHLVGGGEEFERVNFLINKASQSKVTVLITGETGTGKGLVAREIHLRSKESNQPFVSVNCATLPENLIESELFGVERGAFTDARTRKGIFEIADGGTIFLDEIGEMTPNLQVKLLSVLEEKRAKRLGGSAFYDFDVRVIAATNLDPEEAVAQGKFRSDLFYRLNVFRIHLKPLRERRQDIPILCQYFIKALTPAGKHYLLPEEEMNRLLEYEFPGNIRELRNIIERSIILSEDSVLRPSRLIVQSSKISSKSRVLSLSELEKEHILQVLESTGGNLSRTAKLLGVSLSTLKRKLKLYGLR